MKEQIVIRTFDTIYCDGAKELKEKLKEGYRAVMCNPIGNELECILEKETND